MSKSDKIMPFDVAVILGANVLEGGVPSQALVRRIEHGIRLFKAGRVGHLLVTGGVVKAPPAEAEMMKRLAVDAGVPEAAITVEGQARNTLENAAYAAEILRDKGWAKIVIVTDRFHMIRALMTFRAFGVEARGSAPPVRQLSLAWPYMALRDVIALPIYRRRIKRWQDTSHRR